MAVRVANAVRSAAAWVAGTSAFDSLPDPDYRILLLGATGGGKTSFLNLICNLKHVSHLGVAAVDAFMPANLPNLENSTNKMQSQTSDSTVYRTYFRNSLIEIIDTPGMVDTRGPKEDKKHLKGIIEVVNRVGLLHMVVVVANGTASRLDAVLECALTQVAAIMPADTLPKVFSVYTHVDSLLKLTFKHVEMQKTLGIPQIDFCVIDNPYSLLEAAKELHVTGVVAPEEIADELQANFVKAKKELDKFVASLAKSKPQLTKGFKELYDLRCNIEVTTLNIVAKLDYVSKKQTKFQNLVTDLGNARSAKAASQALADAASGTVTKYHTVATTSHNTLCAYAQCYTNCHESCNLTFNPSCTDKSFFKQCAAMGGSDNCRVCTHSFEHHYHDKVKWEGKQEGMKELEEMKAKLKMATDKEATGKSIVDQAKGEIAALEQESTKLTNSLVASVRAFESKSNNRNYRSLLVSQIRVIDTWIEAKQGLQGAEAMVKDLEDSKLNLETALNTIDKVIVAAPPPPRPHAQPQENARQAPSKLRKLCR